MLHSRIKHPSFSSDDTSRQTCFLRLTPPTKTPGQQHSFGVWCLFCCPNFASKTAPHLIDLKTAHPCIKYFSFQLPVSEKLSFRVILQQERLSKLSTVCLCHFLFFFLRFSLTPLCLCAGTFLIQLPTTHPLTRASPCFHCASLLCVHFIPVLAALSVLLFYTHKHTQTNTLVLMKHPL